jgi:hypothetical protein
MKFDNETMTARLDKIHLGDKYVYAVGDVHTATADWQDLGMVVTPRPHNLTWLLDVAPKHPGREYVGSDGVRYRWSNNCLEVWIDGEWGEARVLTYMLTATFKEVPPAEGSPEWFAALPEGMCCWAGECRVAYARRVGRAGYDWISVIDGGEKQRETETGRGGWSLCLHNGERAEPVVGSQFWADVLRKQGVAVHHKKMTPSTRIVNDDYVRDGTETSQLIPGWFSSPLFNTGWSLWKNPAADDARKALAEIDEHRKAVAGIVERLKG